MAGLHAVKRELSNINEINLQRSPLSKRTDHSPLPCYEEIPLRDALVYGISSSCDRPDYSVIELPGGIILGESTKEDVINAFGMPNVGSPSPAAPPGQSAVITWIDLIYQSEQGPLSLSNEVSIRVASANRNFCDLYNSGIY